MLEPKHWILDQLQLQQWKNSYAKEVERLLVFCPRHTPAVLPQLRLLDRLRDSHQHYLPDATANMHFSPMPPFLKLCCFTL